MPQDLRKVHGIVFNASQQPQPGLTVRAFDLDGEVELGSALTNAQGYYEIPYSGDQVDEGDGVGLVVRVYDQAGQLVGESAPLQNAGEDATVNVIVGEVGETYQVVGKVASPVRAALAGLRVVIVDVNIGKDVLLAETVTGSGGAYQVKFSDANLKKRGKSRPDLQVLVFSGNKLLAASEVRYNAAAYETLDILLDNKAANQIGSEHEALLGDLHLYFSGELGDLQDTDDRKDLTYLARKTDWNANAVALAALADQLSTRSADANRVGAIPPAFFYALFRAGLPANEDVLYQTDPSVLTRVWKNAAEAGVIPPAGAEQIEQALQRFQTLREQKLLTSQVFAGVSPLKEMLIISRLDEEQQKLFAQLYAAHQGNLPKFWQAVEADFGGETAGRLQVDGKLGYLTLNNAPLMQAIHQVSGDGGLRDPLELAQRGYHRAAQWSQILAEDIPVPKEIPGDTTEEKRAYYADYLAAQVRLSYPTAAVAQMVQSGEIPLNGAAQGLSDKVASFLNENQGQFEIGVQPVEQYVADSALPVENEVLAQVKRLQRVYQITPGDEAMAGLLKRGVDSAYHVTRYSKETFVRSFAEDLGGEQNAEQTYAKSVQVYNAVLNVALSYLLARTAPGIGVHSPPHTIDPSPHATDIIAIPTLEALFDELDFCDCEHCRSLLSPAAYLVDLLQFLHADKDEWNEFITRWEMEHANGPYPYLSREAWEADLAPSDTEVSPLDVLLSRRPDIQHLPLTCENTNTALPYIDIVNETLEYFVAHNYSLIDETATPLEEYHGYDTQGMASEDLLANPRFVDEAAYTTLLSERFPAPLPFHRRLEIVRRYFNCFDVPLPQAMEKLRQTDELDRGDHPYGWRDIWIEEIGLSRAEYEILTDSTTVPLWRMYGFAPEKPEADVIDILSNAKNFTWRTGITYEELVAILRTRFVNPNSDLLPQLEPLGVSFAVMKALMDGEMSDEEFVHHLPDGSLAPDPAEYGGDIDDIPAWVKQPENYRRIMNLITLTVPVSVWAPSTQYAVGDHVVPTTPPSGDRQYYRCKKAGTSAVDEPTWLEPAGSTVPDGDVEWTCQTDPYACRFDDLMFRYSDPGRAADNLGAAVFVRLLRFIRLWRRLGWTIEQTDAAICTHLTPPTPPDVFADTIDTVEELDAGFKILLPRLSILARMLHALKLSLDRDLLDLLACWSQTAAEDESFRWGWLARKLKLSVRELELLSSLTGVNPFAAIDVADPAVLKLISLAQDMKEGPLKAEAALYLIWNQDLSGLSAPGSSQINELARTLRSDFALIEDQLSVAEGPNIDVIRQRMALVYGQPTADTFLGLLDDTLGFQTSHTHPAPALEDAILAVDPNIAYDDFLRRLSYTGILTPEKSEALKDVIGVNDMFRGAVQRLFDLGQDAIGSFFGLLPELKPLYDDYRTSTAPQEEKRGALLAALHPLLGGRRKRQQVYQRLSAAASADPSFPQALLDPGGAPYPLHAGGLNDQPGIDDLLRIETPGLEARFFFRDTATGTADLTVPAAAPIHYSDGSLPRHEGAAADTEVSGIWTGRVEAPEAGFYNFNIETDPDAVVTLTLDGTACPLIHNGGLWRNAEALELRAGLLYDFVLQVEAVNHTLSLKWETPQRPREVIPGRYLYSSSILAPFGVTYTRFLKASALAGHLGLTAGELAHFANHAGYRIDANGEIDISGQGWLNALPNMDNLHLADPGESAIARRTNASLVKPLQALLDFVQLKDELGSAGSSVLSVLQDPVAAAAVPEGLLYAQLHWDPGSLDDLLDHFYPGGSNVAKLAEFDVFHRIYQVFTLVRKIGIPPSTLIQAATNEPDNAAVQALLDALRMRYTAAEWREVMRPINDEMRSLQRDAMVASILHHMRSNTDSQHIDTPEKLFEYFLMDVQMDPCMQTSRVRHAISTVQLFIERCLMNLERRVSPAAINAKQWQWMKRYRVWEANRKVFLFPENWLEPELRDNKSPFFKEIESELLQSDITEDTAATALLNYLSKLEEVAKLEPCGIYQIPADDSRNQSETIHVVARTAGANRKYYYRRFEFGYWTPWEQIKLDIEDNPVIPVVWKDRLLLFWLKIIKQMPLDPDAMGSSPGPADGRQNARVSVHAILCWSEYYNSKWQPIRTSDVNRPALLGEEFKPDGSGVFDRTTVRLDYEVIESKDKPWIDELRIYVYVPDNMHPVFRIHNTYGTLIPEFNVPDIDDKEHFSIRRQYSQDAEKVFSIRYNDFLINDISLPRNVLKPTMDFDKDFKITEQKGFYVDLWDSPFFFEDSRHVFLVKTEEKPVKIRERLGYHGGHGSPEPTVRNLDRIDTSG